MLARRAPGMQSGFRVILKYEVEIFIILTMERSEYELVQEGMMVMYIRLLNATKVAIRWRLLALYMY